MEPINNLTQDQIDFINKPTIAGVLGPWCALASGLYREFWLFFIPFYNIYLFFKLIINGRKMAWEKNPKDYDNFYSHQKSLSKVAKILLGVFGILFLINIIIMMVVTLNETGSTFGKETATNFSQSFFTSEQVSSFVTPEFMINQEMLDYKKETRGNYENIRFNSFSRTGDESHLQGQARFTNTSMPVCVTLLKFGEEWKVSNVSESCPE
jgi:hypothetical protein